MARKSYAERNRESIATTGKSLYERRKESGLSRGLTLSQTRGHTREKKGEVKPSVLHPHPKPSPKIDKRVSTLPTGTRVVKTKSVEVVKKELTRNKGKRVSLEYRNSTTGEIVSVYRGRKGGKEKSRGISVDELLRRIEAVESEGSTWEDAFEDVIEGDSGSSNDSPGGDESGGIFSYAALSFY